MTDRLELLPAVDVADGQAVRLSQGDAGSETGYGDPLSAALDWYAGGAEWIHLVDLDAAFGRGSNAALLAEVTAELAGKGVKVELSGGIRDDASVEWALSTGATRINLGTAALENPSWTARMIGAYGDKIAVGLDVRGTTLAARGWTKDGGDLWEVLSRLEDVGCERYVVTDVTKDGMLQRPERRASEARCAPSTDAPVVASGGVSSLDDIRVAAHARAAGRRGLHRRQGALRGRVHAARGPGRRRQAVTVAGRELPPSSPFAGDDGTARPRRGRGAGGVRSGHGLGGPGGRRPARHARPRPGAGRAGGRGRRGARRARAHGRQGGLRRHRRAPGTGRAHGAAGVHLRRGDERVARRRAARAVGHRARGAVRGHRGLGGARRRPRWARPPCCCRDRPSGRSPSSSRGSRRSVRMASTHRSAPRSSRRSRRCGGSSRSTRSPGRVPRSRSWSTWCPGSTVPASTRCWARSTGAGRDRPRRRAGRLPRAATALRPLIPPGAETAAQRRLIAHASAKTVSTNAPTSWPAEDHPVHVEGRLPVRAGRRRRRRRRPP